MVIIGIDPGTTHSALVEWDGSKILSHEYASNEDIMWILDTYAPYNSRLLVIELPTLYQGQPMGRDIVQTVLWCGVFQHAYGMEYTRFAKRPDVVRYFTGRTGESKASVNLALRDRLGGGKGTKAKPGPLFGIVGQHKQDALALAIMQWDLESKKPVDEKQK